MSPRAKSQCRQGTPPKASAFKYDFILRSTQMHEEAEWEVGITSQNLEGFQQPLSLLRSRLLCHPKRSGRLHTQKMDEVAPTA